MNIAGARGERSAWRDMPVADRRGAGPSGRTRPSQQRDHLCGPYWLARILNDAGITTWERRPIDQDTVAQLAGTVLPDAPVESPVPRGALPDDAYRVELPVGAAERAGTSARALVRVVEQVGAGHLSCIPVRGPWARELLGELLWSLPGLGDGTRLLANLRTGLLWGSRPDPDLVIAELRGATVSGPAPEWDVGHFCELVELVKGRLGSLVVVADSYPSLGWHGHHVQPLRLVAAALERHDGREGGVLVLVPPDREEAVKRRIVDIGLVPGIWDNEPKE